jgi:hypothetical protein
MKNLHVLPTDKPSRIYLIKSNNKLGITSNNPEFTENFGSGTQNQHIYITSDEEIKEGEENEWYYDTNFNKITKWIGESNTYVNRWFKKIILTTDQDLIKDGVQSIDDEFLEWFVKNPSCEEVDTIYEPKNFFDIKKGWEYKIIIPKDYSKIKEGLEKSIKGKEHFVQHFKNGGTVEDFKPTEETCTCTDECLGYLTKTCKGIEEEPKQECMITKIMQMNAKMAYDSLPKQDKIVERFIANAKQETLEEVALNYAKQPLLVTTKNGFIAGAKWQQERSYSEEEVKEILKLRLNWFGISSNAFEDNKWFEQFKKK